jgi:glycosyltransferase involved in cell wall biosynthesis
MEDHKLVKPKLSVIMPVFNAEKYLKYAIKSILSQSFKDFEFIIFNDGSKDNSDYIIDEYSKIDLRIKVIHQNNVGLVATLNRMVALAQSDIIARMDADDVSMPDRFEKQMRYLHQNPEVALVSTGVRFIDPEGKALGSSGFPLRDVTFDELMQGNNPIAHPSVVFRKQCVTDAGGYRAAYKHCEDFDLWLRLAAHHRISVLPEILLEYRQHSDKISLLQAPAQVFGVQIARLAAIERKNGRVDPTEALNELTLKDLDLFDTDKKTKQDIIKKVLKCMKKTENPHRISSPCDLKTALQFARDHQVNFFWILRFKLALFFSFHLKQRVHHARKPS